MSRILAAQAIVEATGQLHVKETAHNSGPMIDAYLRAVGLPPGNPWCAAFVFWCFEEASRHLSHGQPAAVFNPLPRTGSVHTLWERAPVEWRTNTPNRGAVAIHLNPDGHGHCGLWLASSLTHAATLEGNTNEAGSREGNSVQVQRRPHSYWAGYIDIGRALGDA
jgi:hypothetical protein